MINAFVGDFFFGMYGDDDDDVVDDVVDRLLFIVAVDVVDDII